ncbi:phage capsid protein [Pseudomonas protegens]|uniref:major capsid protein n=1 Tax=Pseudomonas protegens TaxID=380021 RepID=UPI002770C2DF|nr:phage capsid protein [Pseudomonas protegens]MDP9511389.1 phage capsid protein [Pseudomonas protegens]
MATLNTTNPTLADLAKRTDPDGKIAKIIEILMGTNELLEDIPWIEANDGTGHKTTIRSGLPQGTWRKLNYGVQPEKSTTVQVRDGTGMLETYAQVDESLLTLSKDKEGFMLSEHKAFLEGMNQNMATQIIYGDASVNPEKITGLAPRFNSKSAENGQNILDAGGTGSNNTSVWLVCWDESTAHGIYPSGSVGGVNVGATKQETLTDANGGMYEGRRTHYKWDAGVTIRDWRYVVRVANIDVTALTKNASAGADLIDLMVQAIEQLPNQRMGRIAIYCNRTIRSFLRRQIANKSNVWLSMNEVAGKKVLAFDDVPVRRVDAILNTEARVV